MARILIIEDQPVARMGFRHFFSTRFPEIELEFKDKIQKISERSMDDGLRLILISLVRRSGVGNTFDMIQEILCGLPDIPILIYQDQVNVRSLVTYFRTGIYGYVAKEDELEELASGISSLLNKQKYISLLAANVLSNNTDALEKIPAGRLAFDKLPGRQLEIARLLCRAVRTKDIACQLSISQSTVSGVKATIFRKMGVKSIAELYYLLNE